MTKRSRILTKSIKGASIDEPEVVTPSSETTREQNNRFDTLPSAGTVTMENDKDFETTSVASNEPTKQNKMTKTLEQQVWQAMNPQTKQKLRQKH